jgi:hypothetical protein
MLVEGGANRIRAGKPGRRQPGRPEPDGAHWQINIKKKSKGKRELGRTRCR